MWQQLAPLSALMLGTGGPALAADVAWTPERVRDVLGLPPSCAVEVRRHDQPVVLLSSWTPRPGTVPAGTAHLVEHLSYAAVRGRPPGTWDAALEELGGWSDGWTDRDGIEGLVVLPPEAMGEGLALAAARLSGLATELWTTELVDQQWAVVDAEAWEHSRDPTAAAFAALFGPSHPYGDDPRSPAVGGLGEAEHSWGPERVLLVVPRELAPTAPPLALPAPMGPRVAPSGTARWTVEVADGPAALQLLWRLPPCGAPARRQALEGQLDGLAGALGGQPWGWWGRQGALLGVALPAVPPREAGVTVELGELWQGRGPRRSAEQPGPIAQARAVLRQGVLADAPTSCPPLELDDARLLQTVPADASEWP